DRHPLEQRPQIGNVAGEEGLHPDEDKERHRQKGAEEQISRRAGEKAAEFFICHLSDHAADGRQCAEGGRAGCECVRHWPPPFVLLQLLPCCYQPMLLRRRAIRCDCCSPWRTGFPDRGVPLAVRAARCSAWLTPRPPWV